MPPEGFHALTIRYLDTLQRLLGVQLDTRLSGRPVAEAVHLEIDPLLQAIVQTDLQLGPRLKVDLRELEQAAPPVENGNLFVSFSAESAGFQGGNVTAFGLHLTRPPAPGEALEAALQAGVFVPGAELAGVQQCVVYVRQPDGEVGLAGTGAAVGLDLSGRLVSYLTFRTDQGVQASLRNAPSRLAGADRQTLLYIFLTFSAFMAVNQGEAPLRWVSESQALIG